MWDAFFQNQMDFFIFFKSLTLLFLAAVSLAHFMRKTLNLPWEWSAAGGFLAWMGVWLELVAGCIGSSPVLITVRLINKILVYVCFLEFARRSLPQKRRKTSLWIYVPCFLIACIGLPGGFHGFEIASRFSMDMVSMAGVSLLLWLLGREIQVGGKYLRAAAVALLAYALLQTMDGPAGPGRIGAVLNSGAFFRLFHVPLHLAQALLLLTVGIALWQLLWSLTAFSEDDPLQPRPTGYHHWIVPMFVMVFLGGWVITDALGKSQDAHLRHQLLRQTRAFALALNSQQLGQLSGTVADHSRPVYQKLRRDVSLLQQAANEKTGHVVSIGVSSLIANRVVCLLDDHLAGLQPENCPASNPAIQALIRCSLQTGQEGSLDWTDRQQFWIAGFAPILDPESGRITAVLWQNLDGADWRQRISRTRLAAIAATTLLFFLLVGFFISLRWFLEFGQRVAFSETRYRSLFHHIPDGFEYQRMVYDDQEQPLDIVILDVNPGFEKISGITRDRLVGHRLQEIPEITGQAAGNYLSFYVKALQSKAPTHDILYDHIMQKWLRVSVFSPAPDYFVTVIQDLTEIKTAEEAERHAREIAEAANQQLRSTNQELEHAFLRANQLAAEAEAANEAKNTFFTEINHRIRTPMSGMIGMLDLVLDQPLTPDQREHLSLARVSAESFMLLLNDLLDLSKLQSSSLNLENEEFHLRSSLHFCLKTLGMRAQQKGLDLICDINPEVPEGLQGDALRLRQVLNNLVENAIKYTDCGNILVTVSAKEKNVKEALLHIAVQDSGPGVDPQEELRVRAVLEANAESDDVQRLGLAISRQLVQKMQGKLWLENRPGKGATFHFTARFNRSPQADPAPIQGFQNQRVLICEHNPYVRNVLEKYCTHWGMRVTLAPDARSVFLAGEVAEKTRMAFAFVLAEAQLPDMELEAFILKLRRQTVFQRSSVLLMTSWQRPVDENRFHKLGLAGLIMKPVSQSELLDALLSAGISDPTGTYENLAGFTSTRRALAVLVADNNHVNQLLARRILEQWGHKVTIAENGKEALASLEGQPFDLVLMDIEMPQMDGFEATAVIRYQERGNRHLPIIAVTAQSDPAERQRCLQAGMDAYITKPIDPLELFKTIEIVLTASATQENRQAS